MTDDTERFPVESTPTRKEARGPIEEREVVPTREGEVVAEPGDYIIREADGNEYPISADKFEEYYRRVDGDDEFPVEIPVSVAYYSEDLFKRICNYLGERGILDVPRRTTRLDLRIEGDEPVRVTNAEEDPKP